MLHFRREKLNIEYRLTNVDLRRRSCTDLLRGEAWSEDVHQSSNHTRFARSWDHASF